MHYITTSKIVIVSAIVMAIGIFWGLTVHAQQAPAVKRNILLKQDMTISNREAVMALVELPPGSTTGRHTHPAEVFVFVQEGTISLEYEGNATVTLKAGEVYHLAPGKIHQETNVGSITAKLAAVFVAEKGKLLTMPAK